MEAAWAAGFFDGEGSTFARKQKLKYQTKLYPAMTIGQQSDDEWDDYAPEVLTRYRAAVGCGGINGPSFYPNSKRGIWHYHCRGLDDVKKALTILWPYLSSIKREQAITAFEKCGIDLGLEAHVA